MAYHHFHKNAARYIIAIVLAASLAFAAGIYWSTFQAQLFKGAELLMYAGGLYSLILLRRQLILTERQASRTREQLANDHLWRTYASLHEHFSCVPPTEIRDKATVAAQRLGITSNFEGRGQSLSGAQLSALLADDAALKVFGIYLDHFEAFCAAIEVGLVADKYAYAIEGTRVIRNFTVFQPLVEYYQKLSPTAYCELQRVASRWRIQTSVKETNSLPVQGIASGIVVTITPPSISSGD